ncbi:MAG: biotin--[acetyl-CoA-carboxylase] ligase [Ignavibacteria bacterium]|nr:biotin--[acetyl-CoA-carboxylase] ligase [Ignavibacteria bacterium]
MKYQRYHFDTVTSTNDFAKELLQKNELVIVSANFQTKGRGRNNNVWTGNYGQNIYISFGIKHNQMKRIEEVAHFQGLGAIVVLSTLRQISNSNIFKLKYPNDVYAKISEGNYKKIAGILVEHQFLGELCTSTVLGIGINVNQTEFNNEIANIATSLKLLGFNPQIVNIIDALIYYFEFYLKLFPNEIFELWKKELDIIGKEVNIFTKEIKGKIETIDDIGRIVVITIPEGNIVFIGDGDSIRYDLES